MAPLKQNNLLVTRMTIVQRAILNLSFRNDNVECVKHAVGGTCGTRERYIVSWQIWFVSILYFPFSEILYSNFSIWLVAFFYHRLAYHNCFMDRATNFYLPYIVYRQKSVLDFPFAVPSLFWFYHGKAWWKTYWKCINWKVSKKKTEIILYGVFFDKWNQIFADKIFFWFPQLTLPDLNPLAKLSTNNTFFTWYHKLRKY